MNDRRYYINVFFYLSGGKLYSDEFSESLDNSTWLYYSPSLLNRLSKTIVFVTNNLHADQLELYQALIFKVHIHIL